jgi:hypothetical protein
MSAIGNGDWVECIRVRQSPKPAGFKVGGVYRVARVICNGGCGEHGRGAKCGGLFFYDMPLPGPGGWAACAFRPIYTPKAEFLEQLLRKSTTPQTVDA